MVANARLLSDPWERGCSRRVKTSLALKYAKAELAGELVSGTIPTDTSKGGVLSSQQSANNREKSAAPLLAEIIAAADQGHLPIIVVPSAGSKCRLNILNAEKFLVSGAFEEANPRTMTRPLNLPIIVERTIGGRSIKFRVTDDTSKFRKFEWKATVAVFAEGKKWQFSGFPFKSESDLFYSVRGFFLKYLDEPVDAALSLFNLVQLNLRRDSRHQDVSVAAEFWRSLEAFLMQPRIRKFSNDHKL